MRAVMMPWGTMSDILYHVDRETYEPPGSV